MSAFVDAVVLHRSIHYFIACVPMWPIEKNGFSIIISFYFVNRVFCVRELMYIMCISSCVVVGFFFVVFSPFQIEILRTRNRNFLV